MFSVQLCVSPCQKASQPCTPWEKGGGGGVICFSMFCNSFFVPKPSSGSLYCLSLWKMIFVLFHHSEVDVLHKTDGSKVYVLYRVGKTDHSHPELQCAEGRNALAKGGH